MRFLLTVSRHPFYVWFGFAALVALGSWQLYLYPEDATAPLAPLLLWQMFACATGYRPSACQGFFDPALAAGIPRSRLALMHWLVSSLPGAAAWLVMGIAILLLCGPAHRAAFEPAGILAWLLVSVISWSASLPLPRLSGGVLWSTALLLTGTSEVGVVHLRELMTAKELDGVLGYIEAAWTLVLCPFLLLAGPPVGTFLLVQVMCLASAVGVLVCGVWYVIRLDCSLSLRS